MLEGAVASRTADLVRSERLYRSTFDAAPVGIMHVGLDGQWLRVNQRLCDLLGYSREELQSAAVQALIQSEDLPGEAESFRQMAAETLTATPSLRSATDGATAASCGPGSTCRSIATLRASPSISSRSSKTSPNGGCSTHRS